MVLIGLPFLVSSDYELHIFIMIFLYAFLASGWNISGGYIGLHSFGHAAFVGVGAYTSTYLFLRCGLSPWLGMGVGAILAGCLGLVIGYLSIRYEVKGIYFTLITLAFAEILRVLTLNLSFLGGPSGLLIPLKGNVPTLFQFTQKAPFYYISLLLLAMMLIFQCALRNSKTGYLFLAIRENENASQALGISLLRYKLLGIFLSASLVALGGSFWAQYFMYIEPQTIFGLWLSMEILIFAVVGGEGMILGPVLGAALLVPCSEFLRMFLGGGYQGMHLVVYGLILIVVVMFNPKGLAGLLQNCLPTRGGPKGAHA